MPSAGLLTLYIEAYLQICELLPKSSRSNGPLPTSFSTSITVLVFPFKAVSDLDVSLFANGYPEAA